MFMWVKVKVLQCSGQTTIMSGIACRITSSLESFDDVSMRMVQGLESTIPARSMISIVYCH
jgi:hypothetical protein